MCYVDHKRRGRETWAILRGQNASKSGGPVGILSEGKAYLVVGEHKPN